MIEQYDAYPLFQENEPPIVFEGVCVGVFVTWHPKPRFSEVIEVHTTIHGAP